MTERALRHSGISTGWVPPRTATGGDGSCYLQCVMLSGQLSHAAQVNTRPSMQPAKKPLSGRVHPNPNPKPVQTATPSRPQHHDTTPCNNRDTTCMV